MSRYAHENETDAIRADLELAIKQLDNAILDAINRTTGAERLALLDGLRDAAANPHRFIIRDE